MEHIIIYFVFLFFIYISHPFSFSLLLISTIADDISYFLSSSFTLFNLHPLLRLFLHSLPSLLYFNTIVSLFCFSMFFYNSTLILIITFFITITFYTFVYCFLLLFYHCYYCYHVTTPLITLSISLFIVGCLIFAKKQRNSGLSSKK